MANVIILANKVTLKQSLYGIFLSTMFFLSIIQTECPSILDYTEVVAKAVIGLMNVDK